MAIPMNSNGDNFSRERAQRLFNENAELENKRRKAVQARVPSDPNAWQKMRENYEAIILEDHDFSEQHEIEFCLWQLHYRRIEELRSRFNIAMTSAGSGAPQNGKGPVRSGPEQLTKIRFQFKSFLSEATGFYHDLMLKIRAKYGLPLGYFSDDPDNLISTSKDGGKSSEAEKGFVSCHRCLIYLGDLARYKGLYGEGDSKARDFAAASSYYLEASSLWPSNGNPHHQLAILAGYSNDELLLVYRYFRSLAVDNPFATARDNLIIAFEKNRQSYNQLLGDTKIATVKVLSTKLPPKGRKRGEVKTPFKGNKVEAVAVKERTSTYVETFKAFTTRFIRLNGILFSRTSLETFDEVLFTVKNDLSDLLSSGPEEKFNFGSDAAECKLTIVRMSVILIFTVHNVSRENENQSYADILQRPVLLENAFTATFEIMGCIVERCNQLKDPSTSFLLPGILIFAEWLACHQDLAVGNELEEKQASARSFFWDRCVSFMNKLLSSGYVLVNENEDESCFTNMSKYDENETSNRLALPEDFELRGFVPLLPAQLILDFSRKCNFVVDSGQKEKMARVMRIIASGKALANIAQSINQGFYFGSKQKKFLSQPESFDDGSFNSHSEPDACDGSPNVSAGGQQGISALPKMDGITDAEDDDEVIVFKPFVTEKNIEVSPNLTLSSNFSYDAASNGKIDFGGDYKSFVPHGNSFLDTAISDATTPPEAFTKATPNGISQYLSPVEPITSTWPLDHASFVNGLANLKLVENGVFRTSDLQGKLGISQSAAVPFSIPQFASVVNAHDSSAHVLQACPPFESALSSGKQSPIAPPGVKKNPVSRPVRHVGPPPGFGSARPKAVDDASYNTGSRSEKLPAAALDDYTWLDEYPISSSIYSSGFSSSMNQMGGITLHSANQIGGAFSSVNHFSPAIHPMNQLSVFPSMGNITGSVTTEPSAFPTKPASSLQVSFENQVLRDGPFSEYMFHDKQQQFQNGKLQDVDPTHSYQNNAVWENRFFV